MSREDVLAKLSSVRHYCFVRGLVGRKPCPDFRQAFRTVNRLYVEVRDGISRPIALKGHCSVSKPPATRIRRKAA